MLFRDSLLTFLQAGLFAAVLTAFLLFTITKLQADNSDVSKDILLHLSLQLSNSSVPAFVEPQFFVDSHWAVVNALLFASLALVLVDAYLAVLTRGWLRDFDRDWKSSSVPEERARKREMRLQGLKLWKLHWVVALLPLLIQASLVLFFVSLVLMLIYIYRPIAYLTLGIFAAGGCCYLSTILVSTLDSNAPFTSPHSKLLRALIQWSRFRWRQWRITNKNTDDAKVELGGEEIHLAISNRLRDVTSNAVENLPVFTEIFDQWMHTPSLPLRSLSDWRQVLPLVQPYLSDESLRQDHVLRSVARLFLCFNSKGSHTGRQAVIQALEKHDVGVPSIERLYIHFLHQPESDWSLACQLVLKLEADRRTTIELRWILDRVVFRLLMKNQEMPDERDSPSISMHGVTFLCSTAVYIIRNRLMNDDYGLFHSLLFITNLIACRPKKVDAFTTNMGLLSGSKEVDGELFVTIRNSRVPQENRWQLIRGLYTMSCTSAAGCNHNFRLLIMLLMVSMSSAVEYLDVYDSITYDLVTNPKNSLPMLMDILWEIWKSRGAEYDLLIGVAGRLLQRDGSVVHKTAPNAQQSSQDLLDAYDSYTSESAFLMTSNGLRFIEATLSFSLGGDSKWEPQTVKLSNPWLVMHVHNILRRVWCVQAGSALTKWGRLDPLGRPGWLDEWLNHLDRLLYRLKQLSRLKYAVAPFSPVLVQLHRLDPQLKRLDLRLKRLKRLKWIDQLGPYDPLFEQLGWLDRFKPLLEQLNQLLDPYLKELHWLDQFEIPRVKWLELPEGHVDQQLGQQLEQLDHQLDHQLDQPLDQLDHQLRQFEQQRSDVFVMIAKSRLSLYNTEVSLRPNLVPLALFLSPRNTDMFSDSRRLILELLGSTPSVPPLSPPDTDEPEVVDARALCSDFFDSKAIGDLTKWRLVAFVVLQEWETISTEWKDIIAAEVLKVNLVDDRRVDWMARVTLLLVGKFNLSEFMVAESSNSDPDPDSDSDSTYGSLIPMHLRMISIIVEHLGPDKLMDQIICELEEFLEQHSHILCDPEEPDKIRTGFDQARARYYLSALPFAQVDSGIFTTGPSHSPELQFDHSVSSLCSTNP